MTLHCVSPERTPTEHHVCFEGSKPKAVIVIDKSGSLPPTLEHHLAIHLWMGWIGLYVLLLTSVVVGTISLSLFRLSSGSIPQTLVSTSGGDYQSKSAMVSIHNNTRYPTYSSLCCRHASSGTVPATAHIMSNSHMSSSSLMFLAIYYLELSTAICCLLSLLAVLISAITPVNKVGSPNPKWCLSIGNWIMTMGAEYFKLKVVLEDYDAMRLSAETGKPAIFVLEPHDVLPVSIFSLCDFLGALPGKRRLIGCISSACFKVPLMRHVWSWVCAESIDRKNVVRLLKGGVSVCLCPGGVREVIEMSRQQQKKSNRLNSKASEKSGNSIVSTVDSNSSSKSKTALIPSVSDGDLQTEHIADTNKSSINVIDAEAEVLGEECVLYLRERKGFVRLALQHGCPLVPMFTFGQREVLEPWFCTNSWIQYLGRQMGFVPMIFFGQWGLPFGVPKSRPLTVVVGSPVEVPPRAPHLAPLHLPVVIPMLENNSHNMSGSGLKGDDITSSNRTLTRRTLTTPSNDLPTAASPRSSSSSSKHTAQAHTLETDSDSANVKEKKEKKEEEKEEVYEPSDAEVIGYLETFIMALEKLYDDNRKQYGMGHVKLVIM